ncbi:MAG TPA: hypothetical protein VMU00_13050 [Steroidobacteraceae bacterium]|nr:hypothetical protein [Steroidobacteraceae bacterium]
MAPAWSRTSLSWADPAPSLFRHRAHIGCVAGDTATTMMRSGGVDPRPNHDDPVADRVAPG